jgi:hypothetical protein
MDLSAMLEKCHRGQWKVGDLDWTGTPREMSKQDEIAIVQYFTDMAGIERLAGALFAEQKKRAEDPVLAEIFATFVKDEVRHAHAAQMLADYYNVHPALVKFTPHFVDAIKYLSADIANAYITGGELILDVALLRSINDHVHDDMSEKAMALINRDESRHIAIDFHMVDYYCSREYADKLEHEPEKPLAERAKAAWAFANVLYYAAPFFRAVFFEPMQHVDPSGRRMKEAFKRMQLMSAKPTARKSPLVKVMLALQDIYNDHPVARRVAGRAIERFIGVDGSAIMRLYTEAEKKRAERMSFEEMAEEALAAKNAA